MLTLKWRWYQKQKHALRDWAKSVFTPAEKKSRNYKSVMEKIESLDKTGVLDASNQDEFLEDLAAERLGFTVTAEEFKKIHRDATELQALFLKKDKFGLPKLNYWIKRKALEDYVDSLTPTHNLKIATSTIGRGNLLASVKSPVTNIVSNSVMAAVNALERRVASFTLNGQNTGLAIEYVKMVNTVYQKSGYDLSRMQSLSDGQKRRGEEMPVHSQGEGAIRKVGRWYEDIVFKQLMGAPDVASSSVAFADFANIYATRMAKDAGLKGDKAKAVARKYMTDAMRLDPQTKEGEALRQLAIAEAEYTTYTNEGKFAKTALTIRNAVNDFTGDIRLGDLLMPFVKTPANVVQAGIDAAGYSALEAVYKIPEAVRTMKEGNMEPMREVVRGFVKSGLGLTLAMILANALDPDDFVPDYEVMSQKERDLVEAKNASYNSIKIFGKYVSLDYFGPIAAPMVGMMYARKYADNPVEVAGQHVRGIASQSLKIPGPREMAELIDDTIKMVQRGNIEEAGLGMGEKVFDMARSRAVPAIVGDIAKATDDKQRRTQTTGEKIMGTIPGARSGLPEKTNLLTGEAKESENIIYTLLFGSRLKTATESPLVDEIVRLHEAGESPAISNMEYTSSRVRALKEQLSRDRFIEAMGYYSDLYGEHADKLIHSTAYKRAIDAKKKKALDNIRSKALESMLRKYGYRKNRGLKM